MTATDFSPPTIAERFSSATESSDLRVRSERRGDVDLMIASGFVGHVDPLGSSLYRLAVEFEGARGELDQARRWASSEREAAAKLRVAASVLDPALGDRLIEQAKQREQGATASIKTELALAMSKLKSLREARDLLGQLAISQATKRRFMEPDHIVLVLAGRVLEHFLAPNCRHCDGRGFNGGSHRGELQTICRPCRGSGGRDDILGQGVEQERFCSHLRAEIDRRLSDVDAAMRSWMR